MFLLPSLILGVVLALLLGGRPSRLLQLELRRTWAVPGSLAIQLALGSPLGMEIPPEFTSLCHVASYGLLFFFAAANAKTLALLPLFAGMALNGVAILANGGKMPVSLDAAHAAKIHPGLHSNVRLGGDHFTFLGDVFALPSGFPLANVFSVGDILIAMGMVALIVTVSTSDGSERALVPGRILQPLRNSSFRRLVAGKLVSHLGDWLTLAALVGWVYAATESTAQVALLMLVRLAPPILGGGLAAMLVDRMRKDRLLVAVEMARGAAVAGALAAVLAESRPLAFAAVAISGALAAVSAATVPSLVPSLLDDEHLPAANAGLGIAQDGAMAIGALGAGVALNASHTEVALAIDLVTFAVAATLYRGIVIRPMHHGEEEPSSSGGLLDGLRYLVRRRLLLVVVGSFGAATLATGLTNATLPRFLDDYLGLGAGGYGFGLSALAWGLAAGQALVGFARVGPTAGRWIGAGLLFMAALFVGLAYTEHAPTAILLLGLIGFLDGTTDVLFQTIVQRETDPRYYGRIFALAAAFMTTTMMGAVAAAPLVNRIALPREVILVAGASMLLASVIAVLGTRRSNLTFSFAAPAPAEPGEPAALAPVLELVPRLEATAVVSGPVRVVARLTDGSLVALEHCASRDAAVLCAREAVRSLHALEQGEWPFFGDRFLRPDAILSFDLIEEFVIAAPGLEDGSEELPEPGAAYDR
jgi:Na+/melibiose symporter-like transporter